MVEALAEAEVDRRSAVVEALAEAEDSRQILGEGEGALYINTVSWKQDKSGPFLTYCLIGCILWSRRR